MLNISEIQLFFFSEIQFSFYLNSVYCKIFTLKFYLFCNKSSYSYKLESETRRFCGLFIILKINLYSK